MVIELVVGTEVRETDWKRGGGGIGEGCCGLTKMLLTHYTYLLCFQKHRTKKASSFSRNSES